MTRVERFLIEDREQNARIDALMAQMPDLTAFERGEFRLAAEHLASLSPERRTELERNWK